MLRRNYTPHPLILSVPARFIFNVLCYYRISPPSGGLGGSCQPPFRGVGGLGHKAKPGISAGSRYYHYCANYLF